jgi:hypothetical protein
MTPNTQNRSRMAIFMVLALAIAAVEIIRRFAPKPHPLKATRDVTRDVAGPWKEAVVGEAHQHGTTEVLADAALIGVEIGDDFWHHRHP